MKAEDLKCIIAECCNDVIFEYNGKPSGVTSTVENYIPTFQVWHGDDVKEYHDVDAVMEDPFYSGKSILDFMDDVEFTFA